MAYTFPWDESFPPGTQSADQINEDLQRILVQTRERLVDILGVTFPNDTITTATASKLVLKGATTSKIIPGTVAISIRNNADTGDNISISDVGDVTIGRGSVILAGVAGVSVQLFLTADAGQSKIIRFRSGAFNRWAIFSDSTAEAGANAGSNLIINRYDDAGNVIEAAWSLVRSTGIVTISKGLVITAGGLTVSANGITITGASSFIGGAQVTFSGSIAVSGSTVIIDGASGVKRTLRYTTSGSLRWEAQVTNTAEGGSSSGSDYALSVYDDTGSFVDNALQVTRSNLKSIFISTTASAFQLKGVTNATAPSAFDIKSSPVATPTVYSRAGGLYLDYAAGAISKFGLFADSVPLEIKSTNTALLVNILNGVTITSNTIPTLEIKKGSNVDNRYLRLTNTEATGKSWDLVVDSVANGGNFGIFDQTDGQYGLRISPAFTVTVGSGATSGIGLIVDRNLVAGNVGLIQLSRQGVSKALIGLDGGDNFTIFTGGGAALLTIGASISGAIFDAVTGFRISGAAASGRFLRGDGTNFVSNTIQSGDLPTALTPTTLTVGGGQTISRVLNASVAWNPGVITNNSQNATTVTVTGAQVGDSVIASNIWLADNIFAIMQAWVSALNTVTIQITNHSGGSITLTNRTIKVWVIG